ncbi:hypothetical protein NIES22_57170 [Calothrix brevissima NIES-22]|nr:hypothetical protein NIES22_57170 [Calothrix brevissima NIES-22]
MVNQKINNANRIMPPKIEIEPMHPKEFKRIHDTPIYLMHRLTGYPQQTISHWLADESSTRYQQPKPHVLNHFGAIHKLLSNRIQDSEARMG